MNRIVVFIAGVLLSVSLAAQSLTDGEYFIKINQTGKYFAVAGAANDNGAWIIQWDNEYKAHFKFVLKNLGNNIYSIKASHSGRYLSTDGNPPTRGAKLLQWDWVNQDNQKWNIVRDKNGKGWVMSCFQNNQKVILQHWNSSATPVNGAYFMLNDDPVMPAMVLDFKKNETDQIEGNKLKAPGRVIAPNSNKAVTTSYILMDVPDGIYKIRINESGKYLAIAGLEDESNGMRLIQWDMMANNNHLFDVRRMDNGNYSIAAVHSQKVLDVVDKRTDDGTQIQQWDNLNSNNQQWKFYNVKNGVSIVSVATGKNLQLSAGANNTANGTPLIITTSGTQTFTLLPARINKFTDYITIKNLKLAVPHGGDLNMFGVISVDVLNKQGDSYNRYYLSNSNSLFSVGEKQSIDMDKERTVYPGGELKFKMNADELAGSTIRITYGINENDADVAALFIRYGSAGNSYDDPDERRPVTGAPYVAGGSDDFYQLKYSFNDCLKSTIKTGQFSNSQTFSISAIPASCNVHVNMQDEDGSDNWLDVYFTITKERK